MRSQISQISNRFENWCYVTINWRRKNFIFIHLHAIGFIFFLFISTQVSKTSDITLQDERKTGAGKSKESQMNKYIEEEFSGIWKI